MHITFLENKLNVTRIRPNWMFDIDSLTLSMNYQPVFAWNQTNGNAGTKANINARQAEIKIASGLQYVLLPLLTTDSQGPKSSEVEVADNARKKRRERAQRNKFKSVFGQDKVANDNRMFTPVSAAGSTCVYLGGSIPTDAATLPNVDLPNDPLMPDLEDTANSGIFSGAYDDEVEGAKADFNNLELTIVVTPKKKALIMMRFLLPLLGWKKLGRERAQRSKFKSMFGQDKVANDNRMFTPVSAAGSTCVYLGGSIPTDAATLPNVDLPNDPLMPDLEDTANSGIFSGAYDDEVEGAKADFNNLELTIVVSPILTTRIHKDHPKEQIIGDPLSAL
nr:hypothetical protein [Tanacetum cinerariifolium]